MDYPANVPHGACQISFKPVSGVEGIIWVWRIRDMGRWGWQALGNNGEEDTAEAAIDAGRRWIKGEKVTKPE